MRTMKLSFVLMCAAFVAPAFSASQAALSQVRNVYLLPMRSGFEQYLANQLTMNGVLSVVTDPEKADAIFTDHIGERFERRLELLYPPPPPPPPPEEPEPAGGDEDADEPDVTEPEEEVEDRKPISTFSRGRGNLFLVDRQTRSVIWSIYYEPKDNTSKTLNKTAGEVVEQLSGAMLGR